MISGFDPSSSSSLLAPMSFQFIWERGFCIWAGKLESEYLSLIPGLRMTNLTVSGFISFPYVRADAVRS